MYCALYFFCTGCLWITFACSTTKYTWVWMNFSLLSTRGHVMSQNVHLDLNGQCRAGRTSPNPLVINYLIDLYDKTQVQWFTVVHPYKCIMTKRDSVSRMVEVWKFKCCCGINFFFFSFFYAGMWINISMKKQIISILMFWVEFLKKKKSLLNASLTEQRLIFIWLLLWFLLSKTGLICTFFLPLPALFLLQRTFSLLSFFWQRNVIQLPLFFHVLSVWRHKMLSAVLSSGFHVSIYLVLFTSAPSFERTHTPSLSCLAPVRQLCTQPLNERNKNGPLKSLETFMS